MLGHHEVVGDTIAEPDCVYTSKTAEETKLFYKLGAAPGKFKKLLLKAAAKLFSTVVLPRYRLRIILHKGITCDFWKV